MLSRRAKFTAACALIVYALILLIGGAVMAGECTTPVSAMRAKAAQDGVRVVQVDDAQMVAAFTAFYNAEPPASTDTFTTVYLVNLPNGATFIGLVNNDTICGTLALPTALVDQLLQRMMGVAL